MFLAEEGEQEWVGARRAWAEVLGRHVQLHVWLPSPLPRILWGPALSAPHAAGAGAGPAGPCRCLTLDTCLLSRHLSWMLESLRVVFRTRWPWGLSLRWGRVSCSDPSTLHSASAAVPGRLN